MKRLNQVKLISSFIALNSLIAISIRIGDAINVSKSLIGTTTLNEASNFIFGYWVMPIFFWSSLVYFLCVQAEKVSKKFKSL